MDEIHIVTKSEKNLCERCKNYFSYESLYVDFEGKEKKNSFSVCLKYSSFQLSNNYSATKELNFKQYTSNCSQFEKARR